MRKVAQAEEAETPPPPINPQETHQFCVAVGWAGHWWRLWIFWLLLRLQNSDQSDRSVRKESDRWLKWLLSYNSMYRAFRLGVTSACFSLYGTATHMWMYQCTEPSPPVHFHYVRDRGRIKHSLPVANQIRNMASGVSLWQSLTCDIHLRLHVWPCPYAMFQTTRILGFSDPLLENCICIGLCFQVEKCHARFLRCPHF